MSNMKNLMESIDDIYDAEETEEVQSEQTAPELLKEIIGSLKELSGQIADGSIEDLASLTSDLKNVADSLKELTSGEVDDEYSVDGSEEELDEDHGAEDFGPYIDKDGVQNYEVSAAEASSFAQQKGFVGI
jgi:hypothetical protein